MLRLEFICFILIGLGCGTSINNRDYSFKKDCFPDRQVTMQVKNQSGIIRKVMDTYVISQDNETIRFQACNLPIDLQVQDLEVVFSGLVKEIYATERRFATPFVLKEIRVA
jgi:hypothetical protein